MVNVLKRTRSALNRLVWSVNDYFFDIDEDEPVDYVSAIIFYGLYVVILAVGLLVLFLWLKG